MIESGIIALREGIEIALVLGIVLAYLSKSGKKHLKNAVYGGLGAAVLASIGGAVVLQKLGIDSESLEGWFMLFAAIFVTAMVAWMWFTAKHIRSDIQEKVGAIIEGKSSGAAYAGVFAFTFFMIVREGIETVIFLQAVALSAGAWKSITGTAIGLAGATLFGALFIRGSLKINLGRFLKVTACTLVFFTLQLIVNALHEFYENGVFPANPKMMAILGPIVQNNALFIAAIITIPAFMLIFPGKKKDGEAPVQRNQWQLGAGIAFIAVIVLLGAGDLFSSNRSMDLNAESLPSPEGGNFTIPLASVSDGRLHRYQVQDGDLRIRFFVLKTGAASYATAFDACKACYSYGRYYLKNGNLICSQCEAPFPISVLKPSVEISVPESSEEPDAMKGNGCHPIFLPSHIENGNIVVAMQDLHAQRQYFDISEEAK